MDFFWTIIIFFGAGWLVWNFYKEHRPESPEKKIEWHEEDADMYLNILKTDYQVVYGLDELDERVLTIEDWHIRLKEKYKHDEEKSVQVAEDWAHYLKYQSSLAGNIFQCGEVEDQEGQRLFNVDIREDKFKIEEIENRFAHLLGQDYERKLEAIRKRESEEIIED